MSVASSMHRLATAPMRRLGRVFRRARVELSSWAKSRLIEAAYRRPGLAALYYGLVDPSFRREFRGVLYGKIAHGRMHELDCGDPANFRLRRNIHRIEKGLIMRPRRVPFALEYLDETIEAFARLVGGGPATERADPLEVWADDVLIRYFDACGDEPAVAPAKARFLSARQPDREATDAAPFRPDMSPLRATIEDLEELALRRRSVRWYQPRQVPREVVDRAIEVARYSPSACNRQPFEFRVFDDPELIRRVASIPGGVKGFSHNFPGFVVLIGRLRAYVFEYDRHVIYIDASLAAMAFLYALEVQGVSSCCINWADHAERDEEMARLLGLAPDERVIMCISFGYADPNGLIPYSQKKSLDQIRSYNRAAIPATPGVAVGKNASLEPILHG